MTVALHVEMDGPRDAPALVLLNSLGASTAMWDAAVGALAEQFHVVRIDTRGHGRSPAAPGAAAIEIADLGADVLAALDRLGLDRVHLAGLSLGGMIAMWVAARQPRRVGRLALLCTSARPGGESAWLDRAARVRADGMGAVADTVLERWITPVLAARDPELRASLAAMLIGTDAESYAGCCELLARLDLRVDLGRIAAPTLVIAGDADHALPVEHAEVIVQGIAGARLETVPAAHIAAVEQPGPVAHLLLAHFRAGATLATGYATRRAVLGAAHVDRAVAGTTGFSAAFQEFLTRYAWGDVWSRPGLTKRDRSLITLTALVTLGAEAEIAMHVRGAFGNGLTSDEIGEMILHTALYAGLPRANRAYAIAQPVLAELDEPPPSGATPT